MSAPSLLIDEGSRLKAIGLMCAAIAFFALLDTSAKYLVTVAAAPLFQAVWVRFLAHIALNAAIFGPRTFVQSLRTRHIGLQILRGGFLFASTALNFAALQYLQLDQSVTIFFLTPFLVAVLAGPLLGEWIGWRRLLAVLVGFSGVILVLRPGFGGVHWAVIYSFAATLSYAFYTLLTRYLARYDASAVTQVYSPLVGAVAMAPLGLSVWTWPDLTTWLLMLSTGLYGGIGHYLLILAYRRAPAPVLAPFTYVSLIFQAVLGYLIFSDIPSGWTIAGGTVIIASGLYLLHREHIMVKADGPATASLSADLRN
jgi:drug/metabolite transporter (DMT)-like permease